MDDVRAVMDAVGAERVALLGMSEGGNNEHALRRHLSGAHDRTRSLRLLRQSYLGAELPWAPAPEERQSWYQQIEEQWGGPFDVSMLAPSRANDPAFTSWFGAYLRTGASPRAAVPLARTNTEIDVRDILPTIRVPTLVMHRRRDRGANFEEGRYIAERVPGAGLVALEVEDHLLWAGDRDAVLDQIEEFLTGTRQAREIDRVLTTILFTDVVDSTARAAASGDRLWRDLLNRHHAIVRAEVERYQHDG